MSQLYGSWRERRVLGEYEVPLFALSFTTFLFLETYISLLRYSTWDENAIINHRGHFCLSAGHSKGQRFTESCRHH